MRRRSLGSSGLVVIPITVRVDRLEEHIAATGIEFTPDELGAIEDAAAKLVAST